MTLRWLDASTPPAAYPSGFDGIAFYIGGDTPHVWSNEEIAACPYRYRLPIYVRSDPTAGGVIASSDVLMAVTKLEQIGAPKGSLVAWDSEVSVDPQYIQQVYTDLHTAGYVLIDYGSQNYVFGNENPDGYYWGADWTNTPHLVAGEVMTQYTSLSGWDDSWASPTNSAGNAIPYWDTRAPAPPVAPHSVAPPGQWLDPNAWSWHDATIVGVGMDGKLHAFVMNAGAWTHEY